MLLQLDGHDIEVDAEGREILRTAAESGKTCIETLRLCGSKVPKRKYKHPQLVIAYAGRTYCVKGKRLDALIKAAEDNEDFALGIRCIWSGHTTTSGACTCPDDLVCLCGMR
jgi:hypothetical protein